MVLRCPTTSWVAAECEGYQRSRRTNTTKTRSFCKEQCGQQLERSFQLSWRKLMLAAATAYI